MGKLSPSQIVLYDYCPRKYYYRYVLGVKEPSTPATVRGTIFHRVLELFYDFIDVKAYVGKSWEEISESFKKILEQVFRIEWSKIGSTYDDVFTNSDVKEEYERETLDFLKFYAVKEAYRLHQFLKKNDSSDEWFLVNFERVFKPRSREEYIELDDVKGYIDKTVNLFGKGVGIVDYKTSDNSLPHVIDRSHLLQLKAYAYLYNRGKGLLPDHLSIYYAKTGESVYYPLRDGDLLEVERLINEIKSKSRDISDFPQKPSKLCENCFYYNMCKPF